MAPTPPSIRELAERLVSDADVGAESNVAAREFINGKLRAALIRLAGTDGYASLLRRAVSLGSATMPALDHTKVGADGIEVVDSAIAGDPVVQREAALEVTSQLLELLVLFLGTTITHRIVGEACPSVAPTRGVQERGSE